MSGSTSSACPDPSEPMATELLLRRSILFLPADRPERFAKALASGADAVCVDLEDAVRPEAKDSAREVALGVTLKQPRRGVEVILRINDLSGDIGGRDLEAVCTADLAPDAVMLPKVVSVEEVRRAASLLERWHPDLKLIPLVETASGLAAIEALAAASTRVSAIMFGGMDLSVELKCEPEWDPLLYARSRVVHAAALAGIGTIDVPFMDVSDPEGLAREAGAVRRLGFTGKAAIHPSQVPVIQQAFSPSEADLERARKVMEASERSGGAAVLSDGKLIDRPVVEAARRTLALAQAIRARSASSAAGQSDAAGGGGGGGHRDS